MEPLRPTVRSPKPTACLTMPTVQRPNNLQADGSDNSRRYRDALAKAGYNSTFSIRIAGQCNGAVVLRLASMSL